MRYRMNTYDKNYIMVDISEIIALDDFEQLSSQNSLLIYNIYLAWVKILEEKGIKIYEIALPKKNTLKKYFTEREQIKSETDEHIYLYEDETFKEINLSNKVKTRKKIK